MCGLQSTLHKSRCGTGSAARRRLQRSMTVTSIAAGVPAVARTELRCHSVASAFASTQGLNKGMARLKQVMLLLPREARAARRNMSNHTQGTRKEEIKLQWRGLSIPPLPTTSHMGHGVRRIWPKTVPVTALECARCTSSLSQPRRRALAHAHAPPSLDVLLLLYPNASRCLSGRAALLVSLCCPEVPVPKRSFGAEPPPARAMTCGKLSMFRFTLR